MYNLARRALSADSQVRILSGSFVNASARDLVGFFFALALHPYLPTQAYVRVSPRGECRAPMQ